MALARSYESATRSSSLRVRGVSLNSEIWRAVSIETKGACVLMLQVSCGLDTGSGHERSVDAGGLWDSGQLICAGPLTA